MSLNSFIHVRNKALYLRRTFWFVNHASDHKNPVGAMPTANARRKTKQKKSTPMNALQAGNVRNHLTVVPGNKVEGLSTLSARSNQYLGGNDPFGHPFHPGAKLSGEGKCDAVRAATITEGP